MQLNSLSGKGVEKLQNLNPTRLIAAAALAVLSGCGEEKKSSATLPPEPTPSKIQSGISPEQQYILPAIATFMSVEPTIKSGIVEILQSSELSTTVPEIRAMLNAKLKNDPEWEKISPYVTDGRIRFEVTTGDIEFNGKKYHCFYINVTSVTGGNQSPLIHIDGKPGMSILIPIPKKETI